jgi:hypothetical protein
VDSVQRAVKRGAIENVALDYLRAAFGALAKSVGTTRQAAHAYV